MAHECHGTCADCVQDKDVPVPWLRMRLFYAFWRSAADWQARSSLVKGYAKAAVKRKA
jgi:hypothetical protein